MGQKVHPGGYRLPIRRNWSSCWYANSRDFSRMLYEDFQVRSYLIKRLANASVSRVVIERPAKSAKVTIYCAKPGVAIGKKGEDHDKIKQKVGGILGVPVHISIEEVRKPELDAQLVSDSIAQQLERRVMFRRAVKRAIQNAMRLGALGIKVACAGRLNGIEIARTEWYREGRVPLQTMRANVDYALSESKTTYGIVGVKVWVYKGDIQKELPSNTTTSLSEVSPDNTSPFARKAPSKKEDGPKGSPRSGGGLKTLEDVASTKKPPARRVKKVGR